MMKNKVLLYYYKLILCLGLILLSGFLHYLIEKYTGENGSALYDIYFDYLMTALPGLAFGIALRQLIMVHSLGLNVSSRGYVANILLMPLSIMVSVLQVSFYTFGKYYLQTHSYVIWIGVFIVSAVVGFLIALVISKRAEREKIE